MCQVFLQNYSHLHLHGIVVKFWKFQISGRLWYTEKMRGWETTNHLTILGNVLKNTKCKNHKRQNGRNIISIFAIFHPLVSGGYYPHHTERNNIKPSKLPIFSFSLFWRRLTLVGQGWCWTCRRQTRFRRGIRISCSPRSTLIQSSAQTSTCQTQPERDFSIFNLVNYKNNHPSDLVSIIEIPTIPHFDSIPLSTARSSKFPVSNLAKVI